MKLYVIIGETGEYEDSREWPVLHRVQDGGD